MDGKKVTLPHQKQTQGSGLASLFMGEQDNDDTNFKYGSEQESAFKHQLPKKHASSEGGQIFHFKA